MSSYTSVMSAKIIPHNSNRLLSVSFSKDKVQNIVHSNEQDKQDILKNREVVSS